MKRLLLVLTFLLAATGAARASCTGPPYVFSNGTPADANQVNTNFNDLYACLNSILPSGLSTPTTVAQATFPGIVPYQFPAALMAIGAVSAGSVYANANVLAGDLSASRSSSTAQLWLASATVDYNITNSGYVTSSAPVWAPYLRATNAVYTTVIASPASAASPQPTPSPWPSASPGQQIVLEPNGNSAANVTVDSNGTLHAPLFSGSGASLTAATVPLTALTVTPLTLYDANGTAHAGHATLVQTTVTVTNGGYSGNTTVSLAGAAAYTSTSTYTPTCNGAPVTGFSGNVGIVFAVPQANNSFLVYLYSTGSAASSTQTVNVYCNVLGY